MALSPFYNAAERDQLRQIVQDASIAAYLPDGGHAVDSADLSTGFVEGQDRRGLGAYSAIRVAPSGIVVGPSLVFGRAADSQTPVTTAA